MVPKREAQEKHLPQTIRFPGRRTQLILIASLALLHVIVIFALPKPLVFSNFIQFVAPLIAVAICVHHGRASLEPYYRRAWFLLAAAFSIWVCAQADYLWILLRASHPPPFPGFTDFLWISFSFPILVMASARGRKDARDLALVFDILQGSLSVAILFGVMYFRPVGFSDSVAYDIQSLGLILVLMLARSNCTAPGDRIFFREVAWFCILYAVATAAGLLAQDYGSPAGGVTDLAWSYPVLFFCAIALGLPDRMARADRNKIPIRVSPVHMHGVSSVGLVLTSFAGATALLQHEPNWGIFCFTLSGLIFGARALARETQFRRIHAKLLHTALHDELTGLPNRRLIIEALEQISPDDQSARALLLIDLDRFKMINDSMGHSMGDSLLIQIAERLQASLLPDDIVARFGGDEFVVLLSGSQTQHSAEQVADVLVAELRRPILLGSRWITITASIGVVAFMGGEDISGLLRNGDLAMYHAKSVGKDRHCVFEPGLLATALRESELESALRRAIHESQIYLEYQPICDVATGRPTCFEALARWTDDRLGTVSPAEFIPVAENTGLVVALGRSILQQACTQIAEWNRSGPGNLHVSVNVSAMQIHEQSFIPMLKEVLEAAQCSPSMLWLEITESVLMKDRTRAQDVFLELREMGLTLCLDDFGTGFSSLSYLATFPFDIVKIDRSFIRKIETDAQRSEMAVAIVRLVTVLKKQVVVEGVETSSEFALISQSGCAFAQGFYFAAPLAADKIASFAESTSGRAAIYS